MEQENISNNNSHHNNQQHNNNMGHDKDGYVAVGVPIHSQVMKIKQEFEKIRQPSLEKLEVRRVVVCKIDRQQRSRSPLGLVSRTHLGGEVVEIIML